MKKYFGIIIILVAMLMVGAAGQAMASFSQLELIRVVYSASAGVEVATDLGNINTLATQTNGSTTAAGVFTPALFGSVNFADRTDFKVAYFAFDSANANVYVSAAPGLTPASKSRGELSFSTGYGSVVPSYGTTNTQASIATSFANSYYNKMTAAGAAPGWFGNYFFAPVQGGDLNISAIATAGFVDQTLYKFSGPTTGVQNGAAFLTLRTMADGSTIINASAVPVPPSVLLLGSGLLGMIGIRRKIA